MSEKIIPIPYRIKNQNIEGYVAGASDIVDDKSGLSVEQLVGNKDYEVSTYSGKGRVILPKNIKTIDNIEANYLEQSMFQDEGGNSLTNTIFIVQYDFTLAENITIPANCVLDFEGGSIDGTYNLAGSYTSIIAPLTKIFGLNINIVGSWHIDGAYPEWFGAMAKEHLFDNTLYIQKVLDTKPFNTMLLTGFRYKVSDLDGDGAALVMRSYTHIKGTQKGADLTVYPGSSTCDVLELNITYNDGYTEARNLKIQNVGFTNYTSGAALSKDNTGFGFAAGVLIENCGFVGGKCINFAQNAGFAHSVIRKCSFEGPSYIFLWDRNIIEECLFGGDGGALHIDTDYGVINNTIQNNTIVNTGGGINIRGGGHRIIGNQFEHPGYLGPSTHEKKCLIYIKGDSTLYAQNIIVSGNNLGGGDYLTRDIYIEYGRKIVIENNRIGTCQTVGEEIYIDSNTADTIVKSTNFLHGAGSYEPTDQRIRVTDNGIRTVGTRRQFAYLNPDANPNLTFTLHENGTITINGDPNPFVLGQNAHLLTFPDDTSPMDGNYQCGTLGGICVFKIYNKQLIGVSYSGTNYNYTFPVFVNSINKLY